MKAPGQKRVLVVEDDDAVRSLLRQTIAAAGFDVIAAVDGIHALRISAIGRPDVIVLDFNLPGVTGPQLIERWRAREDDRRIPILAVSGLPEGAALAKQLAVDAFFPKPFDVDEVVDAVRAFAEENENATPASPAASPEVAPST